MRDKWYTFFMKERQRGWTPRVIEGGVGKKAEDNEEDNGTEASRTPKEENVSAGSTNIQNEDIYYFLKNIQRLLGVPKRVDEITNYIFSLKNFVKNDANIALRREGVALFTLEQLSDHILDSTEQDWKIRPSFYGAVILEYNSRIEKVKGVALKE